jgi:hypothetical protein
MALTTTRLGLNVFDAVSGTHTVAETPAVNDLILIVIAAVGNTANVAPTDNNTDGLGTYTRVTTGVKAISADTMQLWVRNSRIGSATSTTFTHAPGASSGGGLTVIKITGSPITDAAAFVINPRNGAIQTITLGANRTPTKAGWVTGDSMRLMVTGAGFTLDFTTVAVTWIGGVAPTLESSGYTVIELWQVGATIYGTTHEIPAVAAATLPGINYVGGVTATGTLVANPSTPSVSLTGLTGGLGSAPIAGDVVVVVLSAGLNADQVLTMTTAGFTKEKDSYVAGPNPCNFGIWYKVMTGTPNTSIALSIPRPSIGTYSIAIQVFRGVDPTTQIDATTTTAELTTSILADPPSNTPVTSLNLLLAIGGGAHSLGSAPTFGAAAMTNFITAGQANGGASFGSTVGMGYLRNVAAANDPAAFTFSTTDNAAYCSLGVTMILRAA